MFLLTRMSSYGLSWKYDKVLFAACRGGHLEIVRMLYANGANLRACNSTALVRACSNGRLDVMKWLVANGSLIPTWAFVSACTFGHLDCAKWLRTQIDDPGLVKCSWAMSLACMLGKLTVAEWLIEVGWDIHADNEEALVMTTTASPKHRP